MWRFEGVGAVVTGGGHGIGRASAMRLAGEGARVAVVDLRLEAAQETASLISNAGGQAIALSADVSDADAISAAISEAETRLAGFSVLHANAGVLIPGSVVSLDEDSWDRTFEVNVKGVFLVARAAIPVICRRGGGAIVNTSSTAGLIGDVQTAAYSASKGALVNLTRQMAVDCAPHRIRVNCVCPGWIDTGFNEPVLTGMTDADVAEMITRTVPLNRQGTAEDVAAGVAFLASDEAAYITGQALVIDGGLTAV